MVVHMSNTNVVIRVADGVTEIIRHPPTYKPAQEIVLDGATVFEERSGVFRVTGTRRIMEYLYSPSGEVVFDPERLSPAASMRDRVKTRVRRVGGGIFSSEEAREVVEHVGPTGWYKDMLASKPETRVITGSVHLAFPGADDSVAPEIEHVVPRSEERDRRLRVE